MAITIQHTPGTYFSVHGDLIFVVCDIVKANDPATYPDYRYIADIYIDSVQVARLKAYPNPENKMGIFNISNIVRNYIAAIFNPTGNFSSQTLGDGEFYKEVQVKFGEEYDFTLYTNITEDTSRFYYNHYNGRLIGNSTILSTYTDKIASARPQTTPVRSDSQRNLVPYFQTGPAALIVATSYTKSGAVVDTLFGATGALGTNPVMKVFDFSTAAMNAVQPGFINPLVVGYYTVVIGDGSIYRFDLACEPRYEIFTLHFLNRFGGFESRDFTKVSRKTIDIEKSEFGKLGYTMDSSGVVSYYNSNNVYNETRSVFSSQYKEKMTLNTDILTDAEYRWLSDLILSPMVYVEMDGYFIPCAITDNNYEFRKAINDKLTSLTVSIEFGEQFNAQYR